MRITTRITVSTALAGLLLFGSYGAALLARERADLHTSVQREMRLLGQSLRMGMEHALRDGQIDDVARTMGRIEGLDVTMDVYVFDDAGAPVTSTSDADPPAVAAALPEVVAAGLARASQELLYLPPAAPRYLLYVAPLEDAGRSRGMVIVSRPLDDVQDDLAVTTGAVVTTIGLFVVAVSTLGLLLSAGTVGGPLRRLAEAMARVRQANLDVEVEERGATEIVTLAREFNAMLRELREARAQVDAEARARQELQRSLQAADRLVTVGELSATVAHEIGSPLQVLHGRARLLEAAAHDPDRVRSHAQVLVREAERITRIVRRLLDVTRTPALRRDVVQVERVLGDVLDLLQHELTRRQVRVVRAIEPCAVVGDPDQLRQVVLNLVTNALHATADRVGEVTVSARAADAQHVELVVADDGVGMSDEVQARAFEPLFTTRAERGGVGLGLVVVRAIVQEHGGTVSCASSPGRGSRFVVTLPRWA